jgi:hypothetical protein
MPFPTDLHPVQAVSASGKPSLRLMHEKKIHTSQLKKSSLQRLSFV